MSTKHEETARRIVNLIIESSLVSTDPECPGLLIWSANVYEQIAQLLSDRERE